MKLCPVAIAVGCAKCPIYKPCPLKGIIGDAAPTEDTEEKPAAKAAAATKKGTSKKK